MCFANEDIQLFDNLIRPLELHGEPNELWNDRCDYTNLDECENMNVNSMNLVVLQLNIRSLLAHQCELLSLLDQLQKKELSSGHNSTV